MAILSVDGAQLTLDAPYFPDLTAQASRYRGRFNRTRKCWVFDAKHEEELRAMCLRLYGVDGRPETAADVVDVTVAVEEMSVSYPLFRKFNADIYVGGRHVAGVLKGRPIVRPGKGIRFLKQEPDLLREGLGWWLSIPSGAEFTMRSVARMALPFIESCLAGHGRVLGAAAT
ncbi:hypothetical protein HLH33_13735 [Gluconacetobacter diazotrophicus]|uniref:Uncharacterized protein n=1 Tax=Gluconacetobacter diazotrophicus TaxID=33996 RepID=A0A7W4I6V0_GLUDI|nr:hypothetical protein [Gluconacetobacter diazotrophicus]MBB2157360.1 hypothetical protein [Gluconacetobacter diazotrophicus]